jgi:adenylate cyclase class IV
MIEKELKFAIDKKDLAKLRTDLRKSGGALATPRTRETNIVYDDEAGSFQVQDARLCLQSGSNYSISYERALSRRGVRQDLVLGTNVASMAQMKKILLRIGLRPVSSYQGYRTNWNVGCSRVSLCEFPFGTYVEVTGETHYILKQAQKLGFRIEQNIMDSYDDLYRRSVNPLSHA